RAATAPREAPAREPPAHGAEAGAPIRRAARARRSEGAWRPGRRAGTTMRRPADDESRESTAPYGRDRATARNGRALGVRLRAEPRPRAQDGAAAAAGRMGAPAARGAAAAS